jgi:hypothetical protein
MEAVNRACLILGVITFLAIIPVLRGGEIERTPGKQTN